MRVRVAFSFRDEANIIAVDVDVDNAGGHNDRGTASQSLLLP